MKVQEHHTLAELPQLAHHLRGSLLGLRFQAVVLARQKKTAAFIAAALGYTAKTIVLWVSHYNARGLEGLRAESPPGRSCDLTPAQQEQLKARLDQGPLPEDGVTTLRGREIQRIVEENFGRRYCLNNIYDLLHRLDYSCLVPRPSHEKADPEAQETFKKRSCRKSCGNCNKLTPTDA